MKRSSEGFFGAALRSVDLALVVYKPPDDARLWKPCDYFSWVDYGGSPRPDWWEVKDVDAVDVFNAKEIRPSQMQGIDEAARIGIPYHLAVYWRRHRSWTISDAVRVLAHLRSEGRVSRTLLMSRFGIQSSPSQLGSTLKSVILGEA